MNSTPEQRPQYDNEISLVDLATILIRRRLIFYAVFVVITLGGLAYALLAEETYRFTSLLQVAEKNSEKFIEEPLTTIATLENRWLPAQEALFREEANKKLPFGVSFSNPEETGLIRLVSEAGLDDKMAVENIHQNLIENVQERQRALLAKEKNSIQSRLKSVEQAIETLKGGQDTGTAIAEAFERKVELEGDLQALKEVEVLAASRQSADRTGPNRVLILALALTLAGILGIIAAFLAQFGSLVRSALDSEA
ncbi:MAG: Wzz/FepE/Etk N-terminal domain-containing protein [Marinobacter sp.]